MTRIQCVKRVKFYYSAIFVVLGFLVAGGLCGPSNLPRTGGIGALSCLALYWFGTQNIQSAILARTIACFVLFFLAAIHTGMDPILGGCVGASLGIACGVLKKEFAWMAIGAVAVVSLSAAYWEQLSLWDSVPYKDFIGLVVGAAGGFLLCRLEDCKSTRYN